MTELPRGYTRNPLHNPPDPGVTGPATPLNPFASDCEIAQQAREAGRRALAEWDANHGIAVPMLFVEEIAKLPTPGRHDIFGITLDVDRAAWERAREIVAEQADDRTVKPSDDVFLPTTPMFRATWHSEAQPDRPDRRLYESNWTPPDRTERQPDQRAGTSSGPEVTH